MFLDIDRARPRTLEIAQFDVDARKRLSGKELNLLGELESAAEEGARVYSAQVNEYNLGANFYPHDKTRMEIEEAAQEDPGILDHYTVVRLSETGGLVAIPYHVYYADELKPVISHLRMASNLAPSLPQAVYLLATANALHSGSHEEAVEKWLEPAEESKIDAVVGFFDRYTDKLYGCKFSYQAWTDILDAEATARAQETVDEVVAIWQRQGIKPAEMSVPKLRVRIGHTTRSAGQAARYRWVANNLPCQSEWREKYGSKFTVFQPIFEDRLFCERLPTLENVVRNRPHDGMTKEQVVESALTYYIGHESAHTVIRRPEDEKRLGGTYVTFSELMCKALGLQVVSELSQATEQTQDLALSLYFTNMRTELLEAQQGRRREYALPEVLILNNLLESGVVSIKNGLIAWQNGERVYLALSSLIKELQQINDHGSETDFRDFAEHHLSTDKLYQLDFLKGHKKLHYALPSA